MFSDFTIYFSLTGKFVFNLPSVYCINQQLGNGNLYYHSATTTADNEEQDCVDLEKCTNDVVAKKSAVQCGWVTISLPLREYHLFIISPFRAEATSKAT